MRKTKSMFVAVSSVIGSYRMKRQWAGSFLALIALVVVGMMCLLTPAWGEDSLSSAANMALGKPYTLEPAPNYPLRPKTEDSSPLTDGKHGEEGATSPLWNCRGSVGWLRTYTAVVTVDLGAVQPIRGVSYHTAAAKRVGVMWPENIDILVSDDGKTFVNVGELVRLSAKREKPPTTDYAEHRFTTDQLKARGRYIAFVVCSNPSMPGIFCDEIEVFRGEDDWLARPSSGELVSDIKAFVPLNRTRYGIRDQLFTDLYLVRSSVADCEIPGEAKTRIATQLDAIESKLFAFSSLPKSDFRSIYPLNRLHKDIFGLQAQLWRALRFDPITVWQTNHWAPLLPTDLPPRQGDRSLSFAMMQNEYRAASFNIASALDLPMGLKMKIVGLPGGTNPSYITVNSVSWTATKTAVPVCDALTEIAKEKDAYSISIVPGLPQQIWLTIHSRDVSPGEYSARILLEGDGKRATIPLTLHVHPLRFPDVPSLHVGGWDYTDGNDSFDLTPENRDAVVAFLREHFVDSPWAHREVLNYGQQSEDGKWIKEPDTVRFDQWVGRWHGAGQYYVAVGAPKELNGSPVGTPEFLVRVGSWIRFWADHATKAGIRPDQLVLLLTDEPITAAQDELILKWATAIRAARTGVKTWENPCHEDPLTANQEMMAACDVLCPPRPSFVEGKAGYREYFLNWQSRGTELSFYSCRGPATLLDPYTYYRLQAWSCWQYGATSSHFWSFGDSGGGSSWNEFGARGRTCVPFFLDSHSVVSAKQMEALREGVEDYEYLVILRREIAEAKSAGIASALIEEASRMLDSAASRVCNAPGANAFKWMDDKDRTVADQVRIEILDTLTKLNGAVEKARNKGHN